MRTLSVIVCGAVAWTLAADAAFAIEAVRGKNYTLTKQHGPWMIMVASFRDVPKDRREEGLSAEEAALELVYELRQKGVPAYTYSQDAKVEKIDTLDRLGRDDERLYAAQRDMICVLAGNYKSIDDQDGLFRSEASKATATLQWVKRFQPRFMQSEKSGAIVRQTPGRKGPLSGAFLTINPLLTPEEVAHKKPDPLVLQLNHNSNFPLVECPRKYTVQVATFTGKKITPVGNSIYRNEDKLREFNESLTDKAGYSLNRAGEDAEQLAAALRQKGYEAYVYHDRFQSLVTVGGFNSPNDPQAAAIVQNFGAKSKFDATSGKDVMVAELVKLDNAGDNFSWVLDPQPQIVAVPRLK